MTPTLRSERGIALPLALFGIIIIGAILAALFTVTRMEQRQGDGAIGTLQAFEAAETGLATLVASWNSSYNALAVDSSMTNAPVTVAGNARYQTTIRRTSSAAFLATAEGQLLDGSGGIRTRRQVAQVLRLIQPTIAMNAAVTTRTGLTVSGSADVSGVDSVPGGWGSTCPPPGASVPGIRDSSGNVTTSGSCSGASCVSGSPPILTDPTVTSGTFHNFGDLTFNDLVTMANKTLAPATYTGIGPSWTGSTCNTGVLTNWGAPRMATTNPCFSYFPIIYASGSVRISGGQGQGILLVNGDFEISGGFEFFGPVIVRGEVRSTGTGGHIYGGVMSEDANFTVSLISGNSVVNYSSCAITRALQGSAFGRPVGNRSWMSVY